jgi:stage II sporulation protein R
MSRKFIGAICITAVLAFAFTVVPQAWGERDLSGDLIRFHVIANSDTLQDQQLKREVRDAVLNEVGSRFEKAGTVEEARQLVMDNLTEIKAAAQKEILRNGKDYPVEVQLGNFSFPAKTYGNFSLPAGDYEAVRVVIGEGKGENWWCVLFPPLCFVDISNSVSREPEVTEVSKNMDAPEEREVIADRHVPEAEDEEKASAPVIQIKFKLLELFDRSRSFLAGWPKETDKL